MQVSLLHQQILINTERIRELHRSLLLHPSVIPSHEMEHFLVEIRHLYEVALQLQYANAISALNGVDMATRVTAAQQDRPPVIPVQDPVALVHTPSENSTPAPLPTSDNVKPAEEKTPVPVVAQVHEPVSSSPDSSKKKQVAEIHDLYTDVQTLADQFTDSERVMDKLSRQPARRLSDQLKTPVKDLKSAIGINEKFHFINQLFSGDAVKYNTAIDFLNNCSDTDLAHEFLNKLSQENQWENHATAAGSFVEWVERRVSA